MAHALAVEMVQLQTSMRVFETVVTVPMAVSMADATDPEKFYYMTLNRRTSPQKSCTQRWERSRKRQ